MCIFFSLNCIFGDSIHVAYFLVENSIIMQNVSLVLSFFGIQSFVMLLRLWFLYLSHLYPQQCKELAMFCSSMDSERFFPSVILSLFPLSFTDHFFCFLSFGFSSFACFLRIRAVPVYCPWISLLVLHTSSWSLDQSDAYWMLHRHFKFNFSVAKFTCFLPYLLLLLFPWSLDSLHILLVHVLLFSCPVMSDSLWSCGLRHASLLCPSLSPKVCSSSCPLHRWCHPVIPSSDALFSLHPQSFPASGTSPVCWLFALDDQNTGVSASASVLPVNIQSWFPLRLTGLILLSKGLSGVLSSTTAWRHQLFGALPSLRSTSHNCMWPLGRPQPWLLGPLSAEQCLCFSTQCLGLS